MGLISHYSRSGQAILTSEDHFAINSIRGLWEALMSRSSKLIEAQRFAGRLQVELDRKGWTVQDLVRAWDGSPMPYKWLKGSIVPRVDTRRRLADTLGISMMAFEPAPTNGHARDEGGTAEQHASPPVEGSPAAELELLQTGPMGTVKVHLKVDAMVTPSVASAIMRALEGK
jgi:hypothetical protein